MAKRKGEKKGRAAKPKARASKMDRKLAKADKRGGATAPATATRRGRSRGLRSQPLPGFEQVRNVILDRVCEELGEILKSDAENRADEAAEKQTALREMASKGVREYAHGKVKLRWSVGVDKLSVKLLKDTAAVVEVEEREEEQEAARAGQDDGEGEEAEA